MDGQSAAASDGLVAVREQPNLAEIQIREEIRDELLEESQQLQEKLADRDRRLLALVVSVFVLVSLALPLLAIIVGLSWRVFRLSSGL